MTALAIAPGFFDDADAQPSLDDVIVRAWRDLAARTAVECPVCEGELEPGTVERPDGRTTRVGRCTDCGSVLW